MEKQDRSLLWRQKWPAPAKLNLMLRIVGQRPDGYHMLQTVFQFIDICDWLTFYPQTEGKISLLKAIPGVPEAENLIVRAANLLKNYANTEQGVSIGLEKNLPMGGGLGGGSSDAATTLVVLNKLWGLDLSQALLMELGLSLGADVPVFIFGHSSWGEGVGDKLVKMTVPETWMVVLRPECHIDTGEIFRAKNLTRDSKSITIADFIAGLKNNDCTSVVCEHYPLVKKAMNEISKFAEARLTGTGSCVFGQFDSKQSAVVAYEYLAKDWQVFLVKGINESPLHSKIKALS